jgi:hypothetical protein
MDKRKRVIERQGRADPEDLLSGFRSYMALRRAGLDTNCLESVASWYGAESSERARACRELLLQLPGLLEFFDLGHVSADGLTEGYCPCCRGYGCQYCDGCGEDFGGLQPSLPIASYKHCQTGLIFQLIPGVTAQDPTGEAPGSWPGPTGPLLISAVAIPVGSFMIQQGSNSSHQRATFQSLTERLQKLGMRLPSLNEWLHGFRGGTLTNYPWGSDIRWEDWGFEDEELEGHDYTGPFGLVNIGCFARHELIELEGRPAVAGFQQELVTCPLIWEAEEEIADLNFFLRPAISIPFH